MKNLEKKTIQTLRTLSVEEINEAQSGHPGVALGASPMLYALYAKVLKVNPDDPTWINRDRFVLGAGHGSSLLYASLHLAGFDLSIEDLKSFRKLNSRTPGHPEIGVTSGVDASSGPLGQGIPEGIGMAIAESHLAEKFNKEDLKLIDVSKLYDLKKNFVGGTGELYSDDGLHPNQKGYEVLTDFILNYKIAFIL